MAATSSSKLALGIPAPNFSLPDVKGKIISTSDFEDSKVLLVAFICNHCPYVQHIGKDFSALAKQYERRGVAVVGISANDADAFPEDSIEKMAEYATDYGYTFPYLYDDTQQTAKAYGAACTPDFFLFDAGQKLVYHGQLDDSRPGNGIPVTGKDLTSALDMVLAGKSVPTPQKPSIGCSIKWKPGNEPN